MIHYLLYHFSVRHYLQYCKLGSILHPNHHQR